MRMFYTCMHVIYMYAAQVCTISCVFIYIYIYMYSYVHIYIYIYTCLYMCACIFMYTYIYIYVYTPMQIRHPFLRNMYAQKQLIPLSIFFLEKNNSGMTVKHWQKEQRLSRLIHQVHVSFGKIVKVSKDLPVDVINENYGSTLRHTEVAQQNGILFPD